MFSTEGYVLSCQRPQVGGPGRPSGTWSTLFLLCRPGMLLESRTAPGSRCARKKSGPKGHIRPESVFSHFGSSHRRPGLGGVALSSRRQAGACVDVLLPKQSGSVAQKEESGYRYLRWLGLQFSSVWPPAPGVWSVTRDGATRPLPRSRGPVCAETDGLTPASVPPWKLATLTPQSLLPGDTTLPVRTHS